MSQLSTITGQIFFELALQNWKSFYV